MKKGNFITLLLSVIGGVLFGLGMCMCLLPEWNAFSEGVAVGAAGLVVLLAMVGIRRRMLGKPPLTLSRKTVAAAALGIAGALTLGVGMCMVMVWNAPPVWGIAVGLAGIVLLLCLIPVWKGLK
ncbi:MAG: hypothetical protein IJC43_09480 [Clostridia bacterium]|nr:hypothetical protein [Clostridia bacterium]